MQTEAITPLTAEECVAKCFSIGLCMRVGGQVSHPPVTLKPVIVQKRPFMKLMTLQLEWNLLVNRISRDFAFLKTSLATTAASDVSFTGKLLGILDDVYLSGAPYQDAMLGIFRNDYMEDVARGWKQVEINTISCSFAGLSPLVAQFHRFIAKATGEAADPVESQSMVEVPLALAEAHQYVLSTIPSTDRNNIIVFVIQEGERNTFDQFAISMRLLETHGVRCIRRTLKELHEQGMRLNERGCASLDGQRITVFYFRSTYTPNDFPSDVEWEARLMIEKSLSIKCPSIPQHLCTFKKIQQRLYDVKVLAQYTNQHVDIFETFVAQYSLNSREIGSELVESVVDDAIAHPQRYVLKPQLEGGGNLFSGDRMVALLKDGTNHHVREEYILMERIDVHQHNGFILRGGVVHHVAQLCSEVGVYGTILSNAHSVIANRTAGVVVRSKPADVDDGGVMAGVAALDAIQFS